MAERLGRPVPFHNLNSARRAHASEYRAEARARNADRPLGQKILFQNRVSADVVMQEDAERMNALIDTAVNGNFVSGKNANTKAMDIVMQQPEFKLGGIRRDRESTNIAVDVKEAIAEKKYHDAARLLTNRKLDEDTKTMLKKKVKDTVRTHSAELVKEGESKDFVQSVSALWHVVELNAYDVPAAAKTSKAIKDEVNDHLTDQFKASYHSPSTVARSIGNFTRLDLAEKEEIAALPEVKATAVSKAVQWFQSSYHSPSTYSRLWSGFEEQGIMSKAEIAALPEVRATAVSKAIQWFQTSYHSSSTYARLWSGFENQGIITRAEIAQTPAIRDFAWQQLLSRVESSGYRSYTGLRDQMVAQGVVDMVAIEQHPTIVAAKLRGY